MKAKIEPIQLIDDKMRSVSPSSSDEDPFAPASEEELKKRWVGDIHLTEGMLEC